MCIRDRNSIISMFILACRISKKSKLFAKNYCNLDVVTTNRKEEAERERLPPGTRQLSEEERVETLKNLQESKADVEKMIGKMPISMRTLALQQRKAELEKKVEELDRAIATFSRPKVYIAIE
eukprot:TRINITY_DN6916_c0_g2_i7.p1 TRINITY_DN6916_c0_g2~~TRINITY_DN6916_c0_g2_i7.p1  ORF type:complete len:123 (+),score=58.04 TRINITY_DN6916_c0_g2_i7:70-438(+)